MLANGSARLAREIIRRDTLDVLRNGVKDSGCKLRLAFFRPSSGPMGTIGVKYAELVKLAGMLARQGAEPGCYRTLERKLKLAWSEEKARAQLVEDFAARLCEMEPVTAMRSLRLATQRYQDQCRREATAEVPAGAVGG